MKRFTFSVFLLLFFSFPLFSQDLASFEKRVAVKQLPNGLTVLVVQRHEAPVFSFFTHVDAGSVQDPKGLSGLAHMFEHMAFKGTEQIGTSNYPAEKAALAKVETTFAAYDRERLNRINPDPAKLERLRKAWQDAITQANKYVVENQFSEILERNGAEDMNAFTSEDETGYFYSLPVNRLQLWAYMESERFLHPVLREFYKERDVVYEERRLRVDSNPIGKLVEEFQAASFVAHPYHNEGVGWPSTIISLSATDAEQFFHKYYVPANMVVTVVGDVTPEQVLPLVEKYFGRLPAAPKPAPLDIVEPVQDAERRVVLHEQSQPLFLEGYHRPDYHDPDDAVYDVISDILSDGRTSRLYRSLVEEKKIAAVAEGFSGFPGDKYPNLFAFFVVPSRGHTPQEDETAVHEQIDNMVSKGVTADELKMAKTRIRAALIRSLADNEGLAQELGTAQARYGDWRELFRQVDRVDKVTNADVMRVAAKVFTPENRTVAIVETEAPKSAAAGQGGNQ